MSEQTPEPVPSAEPVLPTQTGDDTDRGWGGRDWDERDDDERYLRERPPHWE